MTQAQATLCIPGLACSPRLYAEQISHLWSLGPVMMGQHFLHESMADIARSILASAPERFALIGLSMGGYVSFEIMRQEEIAKGIAGAVLVKVPECGHCSTLEQPERVTRALMDFLRG
jgi:pimeloyl-ACP methyl ester carboxylesterase